MSSVRKVNFRRFVKKARAPMLKTRRITVRRAATVSKRKPQRKRFVRKRKGASQASLRTSKAMSLVAPDFYSKQYYAQLQGVASSVAKGIDPSYFIGDSTTRTSMGSSLPNNYTTSNCEDLLAIANQIFANGPGSNIGALNCRFHLLSSETNYQYTNTCNTDLHIECYVCTIREDLPNVTGFANLLSLLGTGWAEVGIADGFQRLDVTPFQSPQFCEVIKINKVLKKGLEPGKSWTWSIKDTRKRRINAGKYVAPVDQTTSFITAPLVYSHIKGARFVLTRFYSSPGINTGLPGIVYPTGELMVKFDTKITYKHIEDDRSNLFETIPIGIGAPTGPVSIMNPLTAVVATYVQL